MKAAPLVVVGDTLLDRDLDGRVERLSPEAPVPVVEDARSRPRAGGAGLAAALAASDGRDVTLVTALGSDPAAEELHVLLERSDVRVVDIGLLTSTPEKVRIRADGRTLLRLDRGGPRPGRVREPEEEALRAVSSASGLLVSDYGWGVAAVPRLRQAIGEAARRVAAVWDPHPRGATPVPGMRLVKPNRQEVGGGSSIGELAERGRQLRRAWQAASIAITLGSRGALLVTGDGPPVATPAPAVAVSDPCGAGDRFCATAAGLLADGSTLTDAVRGAVEAASAFVGAGGASGAPIGGEPRPLVAPTGLKQALDVSARVRARGGRVIATGGCFDLLHAGHVSVLNEARALGDCLIVCLNSDASVRRLKGPNRPLVGEQDRAAVIGALGAVDAVVVFDEDTPEAVLDRLRPDVFAKGGDYAAADLPERALLAQWGGEVVLLPYLEGRSTTSLLEEVGRRAR
jgi:rfaE bifunctional protein nucleotidyltransferase chain/domain/rfaE bifunctional protein kinase chain/domain